MIKTNAMRMLASAKIPFEVLEYKVDENDLSGIHIAEQKNLDPDLVFKTLVTRGDKNGIAVFCIPVAMELDLKKCAQVSGNKKVEMIHVKELLGLTGYIRGGCSPVGMKKKFPTYFEKSCETLEEMTVSAGVKGCQLLLNRAELVAYTEASICNLVKEEC